MRYTLVGILLSILIVLPGCNLVDGPGRGPLYELIRQKEAFRKKGVSKYQFEYLELCFCAYRGPLNIVVEDNRVVSVVDTETGELPNVPAESLIDRYLSIIGLFDRLINLYQDDPASFDVEFNPVYGFPTYAFVDRSEQIADEEWGFRISNFQSL